MDFTPLVNTLQGLGPWGAVAAFALVYLGPKAVEWIKGRFPNVKLPTAPEIPKPTDPALTPTAPTRPALVLLEVLIAAIRRRLPVASDADADQVAAEFIARELAYPSFTVPEGK